VTDTLWPDFREPEYLEALREYERRERRFGRVSEPTASREQLRAAR
jgi:undecaprenyl diphosphate synthase